MPTPTNKDTEALRHIDVINALNRYEVGLAKAGVDVSTVDYDMLSDLRRKTWASFETIIATAMAEAEPKELKPILFNLVDKHFPKGKSKERGVAMVLVAEALLAIGFAKEGHPLTTRSANQDKLILDACCGGRMFWFDRANKDALFVDNRRVDPHPVGKGRNERMFSCQPDHIMDFRKLDLPDDSFSLVVFDPPHFVRAGEQSYMAAKYGKLDRDTWREDLRAGFSECFRVLKSTGVLIFKWNEYQIPLREVLALTDVDPLFGHPSGKRQQTHWVCFMKPPTTKPYRAEEK